MKKSDSQKKSKASNKVEKMQSVPRYFVGRPFQDLMIELTQLFTDSEFIKIIPTNPEPFKLCWEFYAEDIKICTICYEAQDKVTGNDIICYVEWFNNYEGYSLQQLYYNEGFFPDWVETEEDEEKFLK